MYLTNHQAKILGGVFCMMAMVCVTAKSANSAELPFTPKLSVLQAGSGGKVTVFRLEIRNNTDVVQTARATVNSHNIIWERPPRFGGNLIHTDFPLGEKVGLPALQFGPRRISLPPNRVRKFFFDFGTTSKPKKICLVINFATRKFSGYSVNRCAWIKP